MKSFLVANNGFKPRCIQALELGSGGESLSCSSEAESQPLYRRSGAREQLAKLWDLCYVGSDERDAFAQFTSEDCTEELLEALGAEQKQLQQYYDSNQHVFEKVVEREEMWKKFLATALNILLNRVSNSCNDTSQINNFTAAGC